MLARIAPAGCAVARRPPPSFDMSSARRFRHPRHHRSRGQSWKVIVSRFDASTDCLLLEAFSRTSRSAGLHPSLSTVYVQTLPASDLRDDVEGRGWGLRGHHLVSILGAAPTARAKLLVRIVRLACGIAIGWAFNGVTPGGAAAQVPFSPFQPARQIEAAKPLARDVTGPPAVSQRLDGTAFFVDDLGHMLTARHAVVDCARIIVSKEGRSIAARVVALAASDIALIKVPRTLGLAAVFPRVSTSAANDMVFAEAYERLKPMLAHAGRSAMRSSTPRCAIPSTSCCARMSPSAPAERRCWIPAASSKAW
ncbi:S1 family peptidase [Bradyrhizobium embrapense]|uniref:S1 family peptidase n=1 Tax=Bradyrhizobium embrapense TaxID=630921 RepID=UPI001FCDCC2F|nr:serine protease [Bradyrhizobium embrapense]